MCQLLKLPSSAMNLKVAAISLILIFYFAECAAGSCINYGHSCWGAHGKRNGVPTKDEISSLGDTKWMLSRLVQGPMDLSGWKGDLEAMNMKHRNMEPQIFATNERPKDQEIFDMQDMLPGNDNLLYLDDPAIRARDSDDKYRLLKLMKKTASARFELN